MTSRQFTIRSLDGLSAAHRSAAVRLFWGAFRDKLGALLGPDARALGVLDLVAQADHALVALGPDGQVVGVAGFRSPRGSFVALDLPALVRGYGRFGGWWRNAVLGWLGREVDNTRFLIDGLAVAPDWRSQGIGSALIEALADQARARGYPVLRLDVADHNTRARALYDRLGFDPAGHQRLWLLAPLFRTRGSTVMVRRV